MSIRLHPEHGLNPAIFRCFYCGENAGLVIPGAATNGFREAGLTNSDGSMKMDIGVINMEPCSKCKEYMEQGIILISTRDEDSGSKNPHRTGGWVVVKEEAMDRLLEGSDPALLRHLKKARFCFVPDTAWDQIGLPRWEMEGVPSDA